MPPRKASSPDVVESLNRKLDLMRTRSIAAMSPRIRAARDALQQARADEAAEEDARRKTLPATHTGTRREDD